MSSQLATNKLCIHSFFNIIVIKPNFVGTNRLIFIIRPIIYIYIHTHNIMYIKDLLIYSGLNDAYITSHQSLWTLFVMNYNPVIIYF